MFKLRPSLSLTKVRKTEPHNPHYQVTVQEFSAIKQANRVRISYKRTVLPLYKSEKHIHKFQSPSSPKDDTGIREFTEKNSTKEDHRYKMATIPSINPSG